MATSSVTILLWTMMRTLRAWLLGRGNISWRTTSASTEAGGSSRDSIVVKSAQTSCRLLHSSAPNATSWLAGDAAIIVSNQLGDGLTTAHKDGIDEEEGRLRWLVCGIKTTISVQVWLWKGRSSVRVYEETQAPRLQRAFCRDTGPFVLWLLPVQGLKTRFRIVHQE